MPEHVARHQRLAVGLISGTSMDGIDAALVSLQGSVERPQVSLLAFQTLPYPAPVRRALLRLVAGEPTHTGEISQLNFLLGELFAEAALRVCRRGHVSPARLSVIGSHGQTIYHQGSPQRAAGRRIASTLQIAESAVIAARTGVPVVADFRPADIAAGGQGAPLVPLVDYLLLRSGRLATVALNIGGITNLTVIPANASPSRVYGFDVGPGNMLMDGLVRHFTHGRETYDPEGRYSARGEIIDPLLEELMKSPFLRLRPPKSAGREQFGRDFLARYFLPSRRTLHQREVDLLRTATEFTARAVVDALERFVFPRVNIHRLIASGGGAHNRLLMDRLSQSLPSLRVELSDRYGLPVDAKEAMAFAVLADRTQHGLSGNLPSVTGARKAVVLGKIVRL